jgi:hypothetical protein
MIISWGKLKHSEKSLLQCNFVQQRSYTGFEPRPLQWENELLESIMVCYAVLCSGAAWIYGKRWLLMEHLGLKESVYLHYNCVHSVTVKFPNWRYYSNTTNTIYWGWTGVVRTFIYMMCKFQLVWLMHMRITIVLVKLVFLSCRRFQNGTNSSD